MAGSAMTFTYDDGVDGRGTVGRIRKVIVDWTSDDTTGAVSGTTRKIVGELIKGVTDPSATAPTDNYDITITDPEGTDVLAASLSKLTDRDTANTEVAYFGLTDGTVNTSAFPVVCDELTISVANAGNSKLGQLILYYRV
jgi:hypothetical protein